MRRYADTFFRYWVLVLLPIMVLPLGSLLLLKTPPTVFGLANVWVDGNSIQQLTYVDPGVPPAMNMANYLSQLLLSPSFDVGAAKRSPLYLRFISQFPYPLQQAAADLSKNAVATTGGPNLVSVTYISKNPAIAQQVVGAILNEATYEIARFNSQQAAKDISSFSRQLKSARDRYSVATQNLGTYMSTNGISGAQLDLRRLSDPKLATLYQVAQGAQVDVTTAAQSLAKARSQLSSQSAFRVIDPPAAKVATLSKVKKLTGLAIPLALGLLLGIAFLVIKTAQDRSLRFADEVPELLGLPILAVVPYSRQLAPVQGRKWALRLAKPRVMGSGT